MITMVATVLCYALCMDGWRCGGYLFLFFFFCFESVGCGCSGEEVWVARPILSILGWDNNAAWLRPPYRMPRVWIWTEFGTGARVSVLEVWLPTSSAHCLRISADGRLGWMPIPKQ